MSSSSREFRAVEILFGKERAALIPEVDRPQVVERVRQLFGSLSSDQKPVINLRFNLDGESSEGPISDHRQIAARIGRGPNQTNWSLNSAERTLREGLERTFPQLKAPARTPQNS